MWSFIIFVVYICPTISCLKGFTLFYHIPHTYGMHMSLEIYQMKHVYNKDKTHELK